MITEDEFIEAVRAELVRARTKFPTNDVLMTALTEEVGEVAEAIMDKPRREVILECVQVATVALRIAVEGDADHDARRKRFGLD